MASRKIAPVVTKIKLQQSQSDFAYWQSQPYLARLAALEQIREEYHLWKGNVQPGLQRVLSVVKR